MSSTLAIFAALFLRDTHAQNPGRLEQVYAEQDRAATAPFVGITTSGTVLPGLFQRASAGAPTTAIRQAVEAFLNTLDAKQRTRIVFPVEDETQWRRWHNAGVLLPQGMSFAEMSESQREAAVGLLRASLSTAGLREATGIMRLNQVLADLTPDAQTRRPLPFGQWAYWIAIMGMPSVTEPWGWQVEGRHLAINYLILGDQVVMTPTFMGAEPVRADSGVFAGTAVLQRKQDTAVTLFTSLDARQKARAVIRTAKGPEESLAGAFADNLVLDYAGIPGSDLTRPQRRLLEDVIAQYVGDMDEGHARVKMREVRRHLDSTYFAWIGNADPVGVFYYRLQSPVILIEFDHTPARDPGLPRNHIHSVVRTPNGNDYGLDLLRQHYAVHRHATIAR